MAKKATAKNGAAVKARAKGKAKGGADGDSVAGYFRAVFQEKPQWLDSRSNADLLDRWLVDHPGEKEVPNRIKNIMANTKSVMRKELRKKKPGKKKKIRKAIKLAKQPAAATPAIQQTVIGYAATHAGFEELEEQIDECLSMAKTLDRDSLADVIHLLRRARNKVVWKLGE
jgi:hypothetical protein